MQPKSDLVRLVRRAGGRIGWPEAGGGGKGIYVCQRGPCLGRLWSERKLRRLFVEPMDEQCVAQVRALVVESATLTDVKSVLD